MSRQLTENVFLEAVRRALHYRITDLAVVERIAWLCTTQGQPWIPDVEVDDNYRQRPAYLEGRITDAPDLSIYDKLGEENETIEPEQATKSEQATEPDQSTKSDQTTEQSQRKSSTDGEVQHG